MTTQPSSDLATFDNPRPGRDFTIRIDIPEFTCLCPLTGQPDFAKLTLEYVPNKLCVELKSLKLYMPNFMRLTADFNVRGGIYTKVIAEHRNPEWQVPELVNLP